MTVYIEYVIIDNFVIDYLLLKATFLLTNTPAKKVRLFLCAILGAGVAIIFPLIEAHAVIVTLIKIAVGLLLPLIATNYKSAKHYYISAVLFVFLTFSVGGAVIGIFSILGLDYSSEISIGLMVLPAYAVIKFVTAVVRHLYRQKAVARNVYGIKLSVGGVSVRASGFVDTGNMLYCDGKPVVVCNKGLAKKLLGGMPKIGQMEYSTADGKAVLTIIKNVKIEIYFVDEPNRIYIVELGVAKGSVGVGYDVILHPDLMEGMDDERACGVKNVS